MDLQQQQVNDKFDQLINKPQQKDGSMFNNNSDHSLSNNRDEHSNRDNDILNNSNNYNNPKMAQFQQGLFSLKKINQDEDYLSSDNIFLRAQSILSKRSNVQEYGQILNQLVGYVEEWCVQKMANFVSLVFTINSSLFSESQFFVKSLIFLNRIFAKLQQKQNIHKYKALINEYLKPKAPFYSLKLSSQQIQVLNIYLDVEEVEQQSLKTVISQHFSMQSHQTASHLYSFFHKKIMAACLRKTRTNLLLNCFIISKSQTDKETNQNLKQYKPYIEVTDYSTLQKKQLEQYCSNIVEMASNSPDNVQEHIFRLVLWLLQENGPMDRKIQGFRVLNQLVVLVRSKVTLSNQLLNWLVDQKLIQKFLSDSTHARILQQLQPLLHFLYQNELLQLMKQSLSSEDIFKVVQAMLGWLKLQHLEDAYELLCAHQDKQSSHFSQFLNALISSHTLMGKDSKRKKNLIILQDNRRQIEGQIQIQQPEGLQENALNLVKKLLRILIDLVNDHQILFMPILLKLVTSHIKYLRSQLQVQIIALLRKNSPSGLWILQHCLKIQTSRERGQGKYEMIARLTAEGVWEQIQALLARHRYSRPVVEKALSVIILLCRFQKPLERNITEFLWKVLALTGRDQRQRQQFFVFFKQIVRFDGAVSEQSVNYIFFELLMSLSAEWFSMRVYDCLQMLFLRLNEDCKLISFEKDHYTLKQHLLIGIQKFWYIYFNCNDLKVIKKCKDFLWKLAAHSNDCQKNAFQFIEQQLKKQLNQALSLDEKHANKQQILILRGFQMIDKMLQQRELKEDVNKEGTLMLQIKNTTHECLGQKHKNVELSQKLTLSDLRSYIGDNLNPPMKNIDLYTKGKLLKGQNLTLRQLKLQNNQTLIVSRGANQSISQFEKDEEKKSQLSQLSSIFQQQHSVQFLTFVIDKYEGEKAEAIANYLFDLQQLDELKEQFNQKKDDGESKIIQILPENVEYIVQEKPRKFGDHFIQNHQNIDFLLSCLHVSHNKKSGWVLIKKLPLNIQYVRSVQKQIENDNWTQLFEGKEKEKSIYLIHILANFVRQSPSKALYLFQQKKLRVYLIEWINKIVSEQDKQFQNYEDVLKLCLLSMKCSAFLPFESFMSSKKLISEQQDLIPRLQAMMDIQEKVQLIFKPNFCSKMIDCLVTNTISQKMTINIIKLYLYQNYSMSDQRYSLLSHPNLNQLLLKYGKAIHFAVVATALRLDKQSADYASLSTFILNLFNQYQEQPQSYKIQNANYASFFACLQTLFSLAPVQDSPYELQALNQMLIDLKANVRNMNEQQIQGYFKMALKLLNRHLKFQHGQRRNDSLCQFGIWLLQDYLFGLKNSFPYFKSKLIRKAAYQLIISLCAYGTIRKQVVHCIKGLVLNFKSSDKEQGQFRTTEFVGMKNLGATCYINSLLQQLYHTVFPKLLLQDDNQAYEEDVKLLQLKKLFVNLHSGSRATVSTKEYVSTVKIGDQLIRPTIQQDVNQYFAALLHQIEKAVGTKAIDQTICGSFVNQIYSLEDQTSLSSKEEAFLTLMIQMKGKKNLIEALTALTRPHTLEGENIYFSEDLNRKIRASSKISLSKLPNLLVITLNRFYWNFQSMTRHKINDLFQFPLELDVSRFAVKGKIQADPHYYQYRLCGIIIHSGSAESGHYYSYIKVGEKWLQFNDKKVSEWDIQTHLKNQCFGGNDQRNRSAYMLLYEKVGTQAHGAALHQLPETNKVIELIKKDNQNFILNRLIYDSNFIDFIKELSTLESCKSVLQILDQLKLPHSNQATQINVIFDADATEAIPIQIQKPKFKAVQNFKFNQFLDDYSRQNKLIHSPQKDIQELLDELENK